MPRYFTLEQANRLLPAVRDAVQLAVRLKPVLESAENELREINRKVMVSGGMMVDRQHVGELRQDRDRAVEQIRDALEKISTIGCQVKDLDTGLLDFPTLYRGEEVSLCWRLGEERIEFWHGSEGFRGRKPIDDDFLANHQGDPEH
ncbi:MAG TPA: DUF2203 domain-containing protein [Bryobacteraceae bacterium]|nr:DUF2203 domain-containing protein [Bryobacteraceae bacterium]